MRLEGVDGPISEELRACAQRILTYRVTESLLYVACGIWLTHQVFGMSYLPLVIPGWSLVDQLAGYYTVLSLVICELGHLVRCGYGKRDAYALAILLLMIAGPLQRLYMMLVYEALIVFCARNYDVKRVVTVCTVIVGCSFLAVVVCSGVGLIWDTTFGSETAVTVGPPRVRHCLGFLYPLYPSQCVFCLTCSICYVRGKDFSYLEGVLLLLINYFVYKATVSRLSFLLGCALVVAVLVANLPWVKSHAFPRLRRNLSWAFPVALVASVGITLVYGVLQPLKIDFFEGMNVTFGNRLSLGFNGLLNMGFTAMGQDVAWQGAGLNMYGYNSGAAEYNYVDNLFLHVLIEQGWVYALGQLALLTSVSLRALKTGDDVLLLVLAATAAHFMVDDLALFLHFDLILFLIAGLGAPVDKEAMPAQLEDISSDGA